MVAPPVAGVAVVADPPERRDRLVLLRLGPGGELVDVRPGAAVGLVRDDVEGQPDRVLAVLRVDPVVRVAVRDEDVVPALEQVDVAQQAAVDHLAGEAGDVDEAPAALGQADAAVELGALHPRIRRDRQSGQRERCECGCSCDPRPEHAKAGCGHVPCVVNPAAHPPVSR